MHEECINTDYIEVVEWRLTLLKFTIGIPILLLLTLVLIPIGIIFGVFGYVEGLNRMEIMFYSIWSIVKEKRYIR